MGLLSQAERINEMGGTWQTNILPSSLKSRTDFAAKTENREERREFVFDSRVCVKRRTHTRARNIRGLVHRVPWPKYDH